MRADTLLGSRHKNDGLHPQMHLDLGCLEDRADFDGELLLAIAATVQAVADTLLCVRLDLGDTIHAAAVRAARAVRPQNAFNELESGGFIVKVWHGKGRHGVSR